MNKQIIYIIIAIIIIVSILTFTTMKIRKIVKSFKIRNDGKIIGEGHFGASRSGGKRKHSGIDIEVKEGEKIFAPFDLIFSRLAYPYTNDIMKGAEYKTKNGEKLKIFYMKPVTNRNHFKAGDLIGVAQSVSKYYNEPKITDHIHLEIRDKSGTLLNPENFI